MSFSSFLSNESLTNASFTNLGNYSNLAGIGNVKLDGDLAKYWAENPGIDYNKAFTTSTNLPNYGGDVLNTPAQAADAKSFVFITYRICDSKISNEY